MAFGKLVVAAVLAVAVAFPDGVRSQAVEDEPAPEPLVEPSKPREPAAPAQTGLASYYHGAFHGRRTASGETFNRHALTAAHKTLPFGTLVRVINLRNERSVVLRVNDRGPLKKNRVIDVTPRAARELGFLAHGMTRVKLEVVAPPELSDSEAQ